MQQTALNTIAIGVFILTISSLVSPLLQISPTIPAIVTVVIMGLATVDTFRWENRGATLLLSFLAVEKQKERVLHHEAGHFLAAYLLGIPVLGYTLTAWEGIKQGFSGMGGVVFDFELTGKKSSVEISLLVDRFSTVLMAGIAAENIVYGSVEGGIDDRNKLQKTLNSLGFAIQSYPQKERLSQLQATNLIQNNRESYDALVKAMRERKSVEDCYAIAQAATSSIVQNSLNS